MTSIPPTQISPTVSIIIPTSCESHRWISLLRAIESVREQERVEVVVIVVINGIRFSQENFDKLRSDPGLTILYQKEGSAPLAQKLGRLAVRTPFFGFLDDDDEYLPGALWLRLGPLLEHESIGFVASNGYRHVTGHDNLAVNSTVLREDPLVALGNENWLASCGGLFRSSSVGTEFFNDPAEFLEWTFLAYKLVLKVPMAWVEAPTFRVNDTPLSLSKSAEYRTAAVGVLLRILALDLPPHVAAQLSRKLGSTYHDLSSERVTQKLLRQAWRYHMLSLRRPGGLQYLLYSRKILALAFRNIWLALRSMHT